MPIAKAGTLQALRREWLLWAGSLGGAITLLGNLEPLLQLADWARFILITWRSWTHQLWDLLVPYRLTPLSKMAMLVLFAILVTASLSGRLDENALKKMTPDTMVMLYSIALVFGLDAFATFQRRGLWKLFSVFAWRTIVLCALIVCLGYISIFGPYVKDLLKAPSA
jgi:hypothetical protein